jgi:hypothetical protein
MDNLFTHGHRQLLDTQGSGLSAVWRRAAEDAARHAGTADDVPATRHLPAAGQWQFTRIFAAGLLAAALAGALMQGPSGGDAVVAVPPASAPLVAAVE